MEGKRVLIIDDEAEIRRNLNFGLMQRGFVCTTCPDGISAIHELTRARKEGTGYHYLITDIFMPEKECTESSWKRVLNSPRSK